MPIAESITAAIGSLKVLEICAGVIAKKAAGAGLDHALAFIKTTEFEDFPKNHDVAHAIHRAFCSSIQGMVAASEEAGDLEEDNSWRKDLADFARSNRLLILQVDTATVPYAELEQQIRKIYGNKDQAWKRISTDRMIEFVEGVVGRPLLPIFRKYFHEGGNDRPGWADQFELFFAEEIKTNERVFRILQYDRANELVALANEQIELLLKLHSLTKAEFSNLRLQIDEQTITIVTKIEDGITKVDDQLTDIKELIADKIGIEIRTKNLVVDPTPDNLPEGLYSANQPWFREDRVVALADMFDRKKGSRVLIGVIGAPGSGKTTLLQALAELIVKSDRPAGNLAVLYVDLTGALRPLRAIANALDSRIGAGQSALDEDGEPQSSDLAFIQNTIMGQIGRRNLLVVFEGVWEILAEDARLQELTEFLNSKAMQRAFQLLEFRGESLAAIPSAAKTELANYSQEQAVEFLVRLAQPQPRAQEAVELLAADYARLLQPGPLANATICFDPALTPDGAEPPTSFDLAEAIETEASELVCSMTVKLCKTEGFDPEAALLALQAMAVFGGREFPAAVRGAAKLELLPLAGLKQLGWVKDEARLIGFAIQALRASAELVLGGKSRRSSAADLRSTIVRLAEALLGNMQTRSSQTLDQALAWCERHAISQVQLIQGLMAMQLQESQADMVSVLNPAEEQKAAAEFLELGQRGDLEGALAALAIHTQNSATWQVKGQAHPKSEFVRRAQSVVDIVGQGTDLAGRQLNAFDTSLYFGSRKFHAFVEVGVLRQQVFDRLAQHEATAVASADQVWLSGWLSFLLNLADQNLSNGQKDIANGIAKRTATLLSSAMDWLAPAVKYRLLARFALQRERLAEGAQSARAALQEAVEHAVAAAAAAGPFDIGSFHYCLRVVQRMVAAENDEAARKAHVDQVRAAFVALLGETDGWPVGLRAQMAALMRQEAKRAWQLPYQKKRAEEALKLLQTSRPSGLFEVEGDPKASLVQARLQAFRGKREAALKSCNRSLDIIASPDAWSLKLRLLDEADKGVGDWINDPLLNGTGPDSTLPRDLSRAIKELRDWTKKDENTGQNYGDVLLWTIQREWRSEGSIERSVARKIETEAGRRYVTMPVEEKRELLKAAFTQRQDRLKRLAHKFGRSINIEFALADNQAQFVRSSAVIEHH